MCSDRMPCVVTSRMSKSGRGPCDQRGSGPHGHITDPKSQNMVKRQGVRIPIARRICFKYYKVVRLTQ